MPEKNAKQLTIVYVKAEELFQKLNSLHEVYKDWTVLGQIDIHTHIEENFSDVKDWEDNF